MPRQAVKNWAFAIHGGAGPIRGADYAPAEAHMRQIMTQAAKALDAGASALDVITDLVRALEDSGHHVAGRGAGPNLAGGYELDASIMDGASRRAGAVACLQGFRSPVDVARGVMERTPHVMLAGAGADVFAFSEGFERIEDPAAYYRPAITRPIVKGSLAHGTVGAVAKDRQGRLAAATSTGGVLNKMPGRVGDTPLIGAGCWADERVAVSCTGQGEYFIRAAVAADVSARVRYGGTDFREAAIGALDDMKAQGGDGGLIAVDARGELAAPFVSEGMKRGLADSSGLFDVLTFR
jgi:L-asparaginase / beta-aspartyl-peptidase